MKNSIFLLLILFGTSCTSAIFNKQFNKIGAYKDHCAIVPFTNGTKNVAFIGMNHVGRKAFYNHVSMTIDSLEKRGYIVFYESVHEEPTIDSTALAFIYRKARKLNGYVVEEYIDTTTNTFLGKYKLPKKYKLINQPEYTDLGVDMVNAQRADVPYSVLIDAFEKRYGTISLDSCDFSTPLNYKYYSCQRVAEKLQEKFNNEFVMAYRNRNLAKSIHESATPKIAVVFGRLHLDGMYEELQKLDSNWQVNKTK